VGHVLLSLKSSTDIANGLFEWHLLAEQQGSVHQRKGSEADGQRILSHGEHRVDEAGRNGVLGEGRGEFELIVVRFERREGGGLRRAVDGLEELHEALFGVGDGCWLGGDWGLRIALPLRVAGNQVLLEVIGYAIHTVIINSSRSNP
jgi:hypothetical protein